MDIEHWRKEIDEIDAQLLRLLNMRARLALKVGVLKRAKQLPFCDPDRERHVLARLQDMNTGPLDDRAVYKLFRRIIRESRRIQIDVPAAGARHLECGDWSPLSSTLRSNGGPKR